MPCVAHFADDLDHLFDLDVIQPGHDLVAQQEPRLHGQRLGELQPLAVGAAQLIGALIDAPAEPDEIQLSARLLARLRQVALAAVRARTARRPRRCPARDRPGNGRMIWKVRPMPSRARR